MSPGKTEREKFPLPFSLEFLVQYGLGSEMKSIGDVSSFGILVLEVMAGKNPTDGMFNEGLSLHKFACMALPDHVTDVIDDDAIVLQSTEANANKVEEWKNPTDGMFNEGLSLHKFACMALLDHVTDVIDDDAIVLQSTEANANKVEECMAAIIKIGVSCSVDSPPQRMKIDIVVTELQRIGTSRSSILGEATIDIADYADAFHLLDLIMEPFCILGSKTDSARQWHVYESEVVEVVADQCSSGQSIAQIKAGFIARVGQETRSFKNNEQGSSTVPKRKSVLNSVAKQVSQAMKDRMVDLAQSLGMPPGPSDQFKQ
nr:protein kinase-like domain-containing protein [Tanacetum cinerariifolium]